MMKSRMMKCECAAPARARQAWSRRIAQIALGGALGLIALAGIAPCAAQAQSDSGLFGSMLKSLGIGGENQIEYRERPPLVVPPTRDLPPPQATGKARDPNWPVDPKAADARKRGDQIRDLDRLPVPQRPAEPSVAGSSMPNSAAGGTDTTAAIPPSQPAASGGGLFGRLFSNGDRQSAPVAAAPTRKSLIEPPPDYESPSPSQPYGTAAPAPSAKTTPEGALQTQPGAPGL
jgi:hypothetical protein